MRARSAIRSLYRGPVLTAADLSAPLLALPDDHPVTTDLPGASPAGEIPETVARWAALGIVGVKVFAYGHDRDAHATGALAPGNRMVRAIGFVKATAPGLAVTTKVCGCSWTDHGECVLRTADGDFDLPATYGLMAAMAVQHADAGADAVSPTAMLDGSIRAVRTALDEAGHRDVAVNPNVAVHTSLYDPFKALMATDPRAGHRRGLQLEPGRADRDVLVQAARWIGEGADSLTLQPVMTASILRPSAQPSQSLCSGKAPARSSTASPTDDTASWPGDLWDNGRRAGPSRPSTAAYERAHGVRTAQGLASHLPSRGSRQVSARRGAGSARGASGPPPGSCRGPRRPGPGFRPGRGQESGRLPGRSRR
ncbi:Delta-aminolevulinic acid dehydratase [Streptomyces hundungensis]|uniref:Delta-aminolevulinic acid dehydratase n=1 Tax=Streptomyces hundungensis TaxID=1077946 RepID=A0A387HBD6_9ACTN|nr:Delta-aminolevulinic acid dehydratase [Streptomyces hundungensis]